MPADSRTNRNTLLVVLVAAVLIGAAAFVAYRRSPSPTTGRSLSPRAMALFNAGIGALDQYRYAEALDRFEELLKLAPERPEIQFNRGIAALNLQEGYLETAEKAFEAALALDAGFVPAHFCLGVLLHYSQRFEEALGSFRRALALDPLDPYCHYWLGTTLVDLGKSEEAIPSFERAIELQPALASAHYRLYTLYRLARRPDDAAASFAAFQALNKSKEAVLVGVIYGESGKYYQAVRSLDGETSLVAPAGPAGALESLRNLTPGAVPGRSRPDGTLAGVGLAAGDVNSDGHVDLVLAAAGDGNGPGVEVWLGGDADAFEPSSRVPGDAVAVALGDLDGDSDLDLVLAGDRRLALFANDGEGRFVSGDWRYPGTLPGFPVRILLHDADSDWDVDIAIASQAANDSGDTPVGHISLLVNNRDGSFEDVAETCGLATLDVAPSEFLFGDLDGDVDQDLVVIEHGTGGVRFFMNDRIWRYRPVPPEITGGRFPEVTGAALVTTGRYGRVVLEIYGPDRTERRLIGPRGELSPWLGEPRVYGPSPALAAGYRNVVSLPSRDGRPRWVAAEPGRPVELLAGKPLAPCAWVAFELNGPREPVRDSGGTWSNLDGIGALVEIRSGSHRRVSYATGSGGGSSRADPRVFFPLPPGTETIEYLRILWPDGILQSEADLATCRVIRVDEKERKPTSCPLLFAWNGRRFEYVGDFLGVGGLGYLLGPGQYSRPDPSELLEIPSLEPATGRKGPELRLRVVEPLEECAYLDALDIVVVDRPPGVGVHPLEMFAVGGPPPRSVEPVAFGRAVVPQRVTDHGGLDVTAELRAVDRIYAENWEKDARFPGVAAETHAIVLDFGAEIAGILAESARPVLFLHGYVEYGYSSSNLGVSQAGLSLRAPTFEVEREGRWEILREDWGFPAGTPRWMGVDLRGMLRQGDRRLRVTTNLEVYWDHVLLAAAASSLTSAGARATRLGVSEAELRQLGFPRDGFPDGRHPRIWNYHDIAPAADVLGREMRPFPGRYTRHGEVAELLTAVDDRFVVIGPGDEIRLTYGAASLPELPAGWKRSYFLAAAGWCKDTDRNTGCPEDVGPLPFRDMAAYPLPEGREASRRAFEADPVRRETARRFHTREVQPLRFR